MGQEIDGFRFVISDEAFAYLSIQRGQISDLRDDRALWEEAYNRSVKDDFLQILPFLPERCSAILDIGSGLGGIDVLLAHYYGVNNVQVMLIDGHDDPPAVEEHGKTFSSARVARDFLQANGLKFIMLPHPQALCFEKKFDVILSLRSWCFHYPPSQYVEFVRRSMAPGASVFVDLRKARFEWFPELAPIGHATIIYENQKAERLVLRAA